MGCVASVPCGNDALLALQDVENAFECQAHFGLTERTNGRKLAPVKATCDRFGAVFSSSGN